MSETARAVTNAQGYTISGEIDYKNLKTDAAFGVSNEVFKVKKKKSDKVKLSELFRNESFSLLARYVEIAGVNHADEIEYGRTENKMIKFIDAANGRQFREHSGRIYSRKVSEDA